MSGIGITIESSKLDEIIGSTKALEAELTSSDLLLIAGRSVQQTTKEHLEALSRDSIHHRTAEKLGAAPTGFYEEASAAVQAPVLEGSDGVSISIEHEGLAQRYFGGTIEGKPLLAIPGMPETHGTNARDMFDELGLRMIFFPSGAGALIKKDEKWVPHETDVYYWLVKSVTQQGDPTVLPDEEQLLDPAVAEVADRISEVWDRKQAA